MNQIRRFWIVGLFTVYEFILIFIKLRFQSKYAGFAFSKSSKMNSHFFKLFIEKEKHSVAPIVIFNSDGNEVSACGNGARCVAYLLAKEKAAKKKKAKNDDDSFDDSFIDDSEDDSEGDITNDEESVEEWTPGHSDDE